MRAITYRRPGGPDVLELTDRPVPEPGPGEVRVRVAFSGVNPTDWKSRTNADPGPDGKIPDMTADARQRINDRYPMAAPSRCRAASRRPSVASTIPAPASTAAA